MEGYAKIAQRMAGLPSLAIFRRFQALRAQDLLYMQAELVELEQRLRGQAVEDSQSSNQTEKLFSRDWHTLSKRNDGGEYNEQWRLALEIREKLEKYEATLIRHAHLSSAVGKARRRDRDILAGILDNPNLSCDYLLGLDSGIWKDEGVMEDLISINEVPEFDLITNWLIKFCLRPYHRLLGDRREKRHNEDVKLFHYDNGHLQLPTHVASTVLASTLPVLSIVVLYLVHRMATRLGLVAIFTTIFSASLAILTNARRVDVFSATAAFAAVQVVFIGTSLSSGNSP